MSIDTNDSLGVGEMIAGTGVSGTGVATKSILTYHLMEFGEYYVSIADMIHFAGFIILLDGFRRVYRNRKQNKNA